MKTHHIQITFEVNTQITPDALHELLCTAVHELNVGSLTTLHAQVIDIQASETPVPADPEQG